MEKTVQRNKQWSRDELILALDVYVRIRPRTPGPNLPEIAELSEFLRNIGGMETGRVLPDFRSPASVVMKLMNFRSFDSAYEGKGLEAAGKTDRLVWDELAGDTASLRNLAQAIRAAYQPASWTEIQNGDGEDIVEAMEGKILTRVHIFRERNPRLTKAKKDKVLKETGMLCCEICNFDFHKKYGDRGRGFIECHHIKPLHMSAPGIPTRIEDLALVCANCHRMLHGSRPWPSIEQLKSELKGDN